MLINDTGNGINTMDIHIALDKNVSFDLNVDSYEYHCAGDFNTLGNGFLEVSNLYPLNEQLNYEAELLKLSNCNEERRTSNISKHPCRPLGHINPYRFWSGKRNTNVWLLDEDKREKIDISSLSKICDIYRVAHVNIRLNTYKFHIEGYGETQRLDIMDIYLAEK